MRLFCIHSGFAHSLLNLVESFKEPSVLSLEITLAFHIQFIHWLLIKLLCNSGQLWILFLFKSLNLIMD